LNFEFSPNGFRGVNMAERGIMPLLRDTSMKGTRSYCIDSA
jgi:hypothetical protein